MKDQIKSEVQEQIAKIKSLEHIILNSQYNCLLFTGTANGNVLANAFANNLIENKNMLIKSIKLIPYANTETDVFWNDTGAEHFTVPNTARLINVVDFFTTGATIDVVINGVSLRLFPQTAVAGFPFDIFVDNIYYWYKSKIENIAVTVNGFVFLDLDAATTIAPLIKVVIECYLF